VASSDLCSGLGTHILALHAFDGGRRVWNTVIVSLKQVAD